MPGIVLIMIFVGMPALALSVAALRTEPFRSWSPWVWFAFYTFLNITDAATTWLGVHRNGGVADFSVEMNELVRFLFYRFGFWPGILIHKGFFILVPFILCWKIKNPKRRAGLANVLSVCAFGLFLITILNLLALVI